MAVKIFDGLVISTFSMPLGHEILYSRPMKNIFILALCLFTLSATAARKTPSEKLWEAVEDDNLRKASRALDKGADPDAVNNPSAPTTTIFLRAAVLNRVEMIRLMLDHKASIDQGRPIDHHTALMISATRNNAELAQLLVSRGANINVDTIFSRTALQIAALNNSLAVAKVLLAQENIDVNHRPNLCALAVASRQGFKEMVVLIGGQVEAKAPSVECLQAAIGMAEYNHHEDILAILRGL
jgi:hypothetical protein